MGGGEEGRLSTRRGVKGVERGGGGVPRNVKAAEGLTRVYKLF